MNQVKLKSDLLAGSVVSAKMLGNVPFHRQLRPKSQTTPSPDKVTITLSTVTLLSVTLLTTLGQRSAKFKIS